MRMAVYQPWHDKPQRGVDDLLALELLPQVGGLADGGDAVLADRDRAVGDDLAPAVEREQRPVLDQNIDVLDHCLISSYKRSHRNMIAPRLHHELSASVVDRDES